MNRANVLLDDNGDFTNSYSNIGFWLKYFLIFVVALTSFDLFEDRLEGAPLTHLITEGIVVIGALIFLMIFWTRSLKGLKQVHSHLAKELVQRNQDLKLFKEKTDSLYKGLSIEIYRQFTKWGLSSAEQDIALLLLKGLSFKEISGMRNTNEKTVRQQAAQIYSKSGLSGRAELSAFFLEDLLSPPIIQ